MKQNNPVLVYLRHYFRGAAASAWNGGWCSLGSSGAKAAAITFGAKAVAPATPHEILTVWLWAAFGAMALYFYANKLPVSALPTPGAEPAPSPAAAAAASARPTILPQAAPLIAIGLLLLSGGLAGCSTTGSTIDAATTTLKVSSPKGQTFAVAFPKELNSSKFVLDLDPATGHVKVTADTIQTSSSQIIENAGNASAQATLAMAQAFQSIAPALAQAAQVGAAATAVAVPAAAPAIAAAKVAAASIPPPAPPKPVTPAPL